MKMKQWVFNWTCTRLDGERSHMNLSRLLGFRRHQIISSDFSSTQHKKKFGFAFALITLAIMVIFLSPTGTQAQSQITHGDWGCGGNFTGCGSNTYPTMVTIPGSNSSGYAETTVVSNGGPYIGEIALQYLSEYLFCPCYYSSTTVKIT